MIGKDEARGTWYVQIKVKDPVSGKWKAIRKRGFKLKREAQTWEAEQKASQNSAESSISFSAMADEYLSSMDTSAPTAAQKRAKFRLYFSDYMDRSISSISKSEMMRWRQWLSGKELSTQTKNLVLQYVKAVFRYAAKIYGIQDPGIYLKAFKKTDAEVNQEMQTWTPEEFEKFSASVRFPVYRIFFEFLYWTGCRRGEALAITKDRITPDGHVTIRESIKHFSDGAKSTKNRKIRTIQLDPQLIEDIRPLMEADGIYLFYGDRTLPITNIQREFTRAIKASGVKPIRLHDLRHSHVSNLIAAGVPVPAVAQRIGDTIQQVEKTYAHMMPDSEQFMNDQIARLHKKQ